MADWTDPPYSGLVAGKAWTDEKASAAFENVVALAEEAMGAPKIKRRAFSGTGTTVTFTGLGEYSGIEFSASATNASGFDRDITLEYSTNGGSTWSVPDTLAVVKASGGATRIGGGFDFATGAVAVEGLAFSTFDAVVHLSSTISGASLAIDAVRFAGGPLAVIIRPNGGTV